MDEQIMNCDVKVINGELSCCTCKHFKCSYIKYGYQNIECDKHCLEISFELGTPFCCGMYKPTKRFKKYLSKRGK